MSIPEKSRTIYRLYAVAFLSLFLFAADVMAQSFPVIFESTSRAILSARRSGVMHRLDADVGAVLKKGAQIAAIDTHELKLQKKRSVLALKYLNSRLSDFKKLSAKGLATNEEIQKTQMERDVTYTDIEILKHQIRKSKITAPYKCVVVRRHVRAHEWVVEGKPIVEVVDPSALRAIANIPSALAVKFKVGETHELSVPDLGITVTGTVQAVVPEVDELSNTAQILWKVKTVPEHLLAGMKGEVRFVQ